MVDISELTYSETVVTEGAWVAPLPEWPEFLVHAKVSLYKREDLRAAKLKALNKKWQDNIPTRLLNKANLEACLESSILDAKGLTSGEGENQQPVPFDEMKSRALADPAGKLAGAFFLAAELVKSRTAEELEADTGN